MCYDEPPGCFHPAAIAMLNELESLGVAWCTNSGRAREDQLGVLERSRAQGLRYMPAALLCCESLIFERHAGAYRALEPWNTYIVGELRRLRRAVRDQLAPDLPDLLERYHPDVYCTDEYTAFNVKMDDALHERFQAELERRLAPLTGYVIEHNGGWFSILPDTAGKGNALRHYAETRGFPTDRVLAIGDHFNDLSMLDGRAVRLVGCPGDAIPEVQAAIRHAGGYVASAGGPPGTVEVMRFFLDSKFKVQSSRLDIEI
jgi:hypothetical protein